MKLCPRFDKPLLGPWQSPGYQLGDVWFSAVSSAAFGVSGVVVDEGGAPLAGAMVTLMPGSQPEMPFPFLIGLADRNGAFTVSGVLPGDYFVIANPSVESSFGAGGGGFSIGFGVETVAGSEPVVVFDTPSGRPAALLPAGRTGHRRGSPRTETA